MESHHRAMSSGQFDHHSQNKSANQLDQKLVTRVQKGDRTAFDLLLVKYQNRVASIVSRFVDTPEDIADVTQEVFIRAYRAIHSFRGDSAFYTWLFRIAINYAKIFLQKNKTRKVYQEKEYSEGQVKDQSKLFNLESPENILSRPELAEGIENALAVMPAELSVALILREFDALSYEEISKVMDCPIDSVRSRIFRARELLDNTIKSFSGC
ncbi:MAG: RNA polymerase sigma-70 factor (ECF subfamily) [Oleiphilaceae bacterium]|jgi:RNA polymerase sigma-70 factor (ECF subfamily)